MTMTILRPKITKIGLQTIRDSLANDGKLIRITEIKAGDIGYTPTGEEVDLKHTRVSGKVSVQKKANNNNNNIFHIVSTLNNKSENFTVYEIGLFTSDGILLAIYANVEGLLPLAKETPTLVAFDLAFVSKEEIKIDMSDSVENIGVTYAAELATVGIKLLEATSIFIKTEGEMLKLIAKNTELERRMEEIERWRIKHG